MVNRQSKKVSLKLKLKLKFRPIGAIATRRNDKVTPEDLSDLLGIGLKTGKRTLAATTHQRIRTVGNLTCRFLWIKPTCDTKSSQQEERRFMSIPSSQKSYQ